MTHTAIKRRKENVLVVDNSREFTGAFKSILELTTALKDNFNFFYCLPNNSKLTHELRVKNLRCFTLPFVEIQKSVKVFLYVPYLIYNAIKIVVFCKRNKINTLHINDLYNMCGVLAKIINPKVKVIYHVRLVQASYIKGMYSFFVKQIAKRAYAVIAVSETVKKGLNDLGVESLVIYDAISVEEKYSPTVIKESTSSLTLLYLANFTLGKGHAQAIKAFVIAQKEIPDLKMIMAGGDMGLKKNMRLKTDLKETVRAFGLADQIIFYDYVSDAEKLIKSSDIVLNFSESESFSLTCLEALTYGTPLIATDSGGPRELFEHDQSGLLVPNRDIDAMAEAIIHLARDQKLRRDFSAAGREYVRKKFGTKKSAQALSSLYEHIEQ